MLPVIRQTVRKSFSRQRVAKTIRRESCRCETFTSLSSSSSSYNAVIPKKKPMFVNPLLQWLENHHHHHHRSTTISSTGMGSVRFFQSEAEFHSVADETLECILEELEGLFEDHLSSDGGEENEFPELNYAAGVFTMKLPPHGTWVLNKQTPNRQIWWSSPLSGPRRYEYDEQEELWVNTRYADAILQYNGFLNDQDRQLFQGDITLGDILKKEIQELYSLPISDLNV